MYPHLTLSPPIMCIINDPLPGFSTIFKCAGYLIPLIDNRRLEDVRCDVLVVPRDVDEEDEVAADLQHRKDSSDRGDQRDSLFPDGHRYSAKSDRVILKRKWNFKFRIPFLSVPFWLPVFFQPSSNHKQLSVP